MWFFGLSADAASFDLTGATGGSTQTVQQTVGSDTMVITTTDDVMVVDSDTNVWGGGINDTSGTVMAVASGVGYESSLRITVSGGKVFDLASFTLVDIAGENKDLTITTNKGSATLTSNFSSLSWSVALASATFQGITYADITTNHVSNHFAWGFDNFVLNNIVLAPPTVTDARISINSTGSGTGGAYKIGDTVTASWNNTAGGDNNAGITGVTMDFSQFGGGTAVIATNSSGTWTASFTLVAGAIDTGNRNVSVSATSPSGTTTLADTTNLTVDNIAPTVTDANISISGASGTGGAFKIGDTVTATWNDTAGGDNNSDTIFSVTVNFSQFGGGAAVSAANSSGTWTATYTITAGASDTTSRNVAVTATDNAGNTITRADTTNATVDNIAPTVTDARLSLSGATGNGGVFKIGDTATATWNNTAGGDNNTDTISSVTVNFSQFGGGSTVTANNSSGTWTATYTVVAGAIEMTNRNMSVSVTDNAGNNTTRADTTNATVDNLAPAAPGTPDLMNAFDSGVSSTDDLTNLTTPNFTGTAEANQTVNLYDTDGATVLGTTTANASGDWLITSSTLSEGVHTITAKNIDNAGNIGPASTGLSITIDTDTPSTTIATAAFSADTGTSNTDFITKTAAQTISGTTSASLVSSEIVEVSLDNGATWAAATTSLGSNLWSLSGQTLTASDTMKVRVSDLAGNAGSAASQAYVLDTTATTTTIPTMAFSADTGVSSTDFVTNTAAQTVSGTTSANVVSGEIVEVSLDNGSTWTSAAASVGSDTWSLPGQTLTSSNTLKARVTDAAGNHGTAASQAYVLDTNAPFVSSVGLPSSATYIAGQNLDFTATFSEATTVTGTPQLSVTLDTGGTVYAGYVSGSGTATLTFRYTVVAGELDLTGITLGSALQLNGGTLRDNTNNDAILTLSAGSTAGILVDAVAPDVNSVSVPANATYHTGQPLTFTVNFTKNVVVTGSPQLLVTLDSGAVNASYVSGSGGSALSFAYTVTSGDTDGNGISVGSSIAANGGTLNDTAGNNATLTLNNVGATTAVLVDANAPSVSSINRQSPGSATTNAASATYRITFSEDVSGVDTADFTLTATGTVTGNIASVSPVSAAVYDVTVNSISGSGTLRVDLKTSGTGITDLPGNAIAAGFTSGQVYTFDTDAPFISDVGLPSNATYVAGQNLDFTATFTEATTVSGTPRLPVTLDTGGTVYAGYVSGSGSTTLTFRYTVAAGDLDLTGITLGAAVQLNGGTLRDGTNNEATLTLSAGSTAGILVDAVAPAVSSVSPPANGTHKAGDQLDFTTSFSEAVTVNTGGGTPHLAVTLDTGGTVHASYLSGSGTSALVFRYTIVSSDADTTGITLGSTIVPNGGTLRDAAGNDSATLLSNVGSTAAVLVDGIAPTVSSIVRVNGASNNSPSLDYTVTFSESVTGVGTTDFTLTATGTASATIASIATISGSTYTVTLSSVTGDGTLRLDLNANGTGITDVPGNPIATGFTAGEAYTLDHTSPAISSVSVPANATYVSGQNLDFTVNMGEAATINTTGGTPFLPVTLNTGGTVQATYVSGSGGAALVFRYTIVTGNLDLDGISLGTSLSANGGTLRDAVGNDVTLTLNNVASTAGVLVDAVAPTVSSVGVPANGTYAKAATLDFTVTYAEAVTVDATGGTPTLAIGLTTGGPATATYLSGSGSPTLTFRYIVAAGEEDADGISVSPGIALNSATLRDSGGNDAVLTTPAFSTAGILIDGRIPTVSSIVRQAPTSSTTSLSSLNYRVTFSENVTGVDSSDFALTATATAAGTVGAITSVSGTVYDVAVTVVTRGGTLRLDVPATAQIKDAVDNSLTDAFTAGEVYTLVSNRPPTFTAGDDIAAAQDAGPQTFAQWATNIDAGAPEESAQVLHFTVTVDEPSLFTTAPAIAPDGTLTFTPAATANGTATVTVILSDDGGGESAGIQSSEPVTFKIALTTYDEETGAYNGLVQSAPDTAPSNDKTGVIRVVVGKKGAFTGTLKMAGLSTTLKGTFDKGGVAQFGKPAVPTFTLKRKGLPSLTLALKLDVGLGTDKLTGTLKDADADFAVIEADRCLYVAKKNPVAPYRNVPTAVLGRFTVVFTANPPTLAPSSPPISFPQGDGVGILTVNTSGAARLTGTLADGTVISCSNSLSKDNTWPLYVTIHVAKGSVSGQVSFRDTPEISDLDSLNVHWFKPATKGKKYPDGWPNGMHVNLLGSRLVIPKVVTKSSIFSGVETPDTDPNATVTFTDGGLTDALSKALEIKAGTGAKVLEPGADKLTLKILFPRNPNGRFSGTFVHPVTRLKSAFNGVIFQKQRSGFGYFLGTTECGGMTLDSVILPP